MSKNASQSSARKDWGYRCQLPYNEQPDFLTKPPNLQREFDLNRDPYIRLQLLSLEQAERKQREGSRGSGSREEEQGRGSSMVGKDQPAMHYKPPEQIRKAIDRSKFNRDWMREQYKATMVNKDTQHQREAWDHNHQHGQNPNQNRGPAPER